MPDPHAADQPGPKPLGPVQRVVAGLGVLFGLGVALLVAEAWIGIGLGPGAEDGLSTAVLALGAALVVSGFFLGENPAPTVGATTRHQPPGSEALEGGEPAADPATSATTSEKPAKPAPQAARMHGGEQPAVARGGARAPEAAPQPEGSGVPPEPSRAGGASWVPVALAVTGLLAVAAATLAGPIVAADLAAMGGAPFGTAGALPAGNDPRGAALIATALTRVGLVAALAPVAVALVAAWREARTAGAPS